MVRQLLQADKVIHMQQLGWDWRPPDDSVFMPVHAQAEATGRPDTAATGDGEGGSGGEEENAAAKGEGEVAERLKDARNWGALGLLVDEAGFLMDTKARNMVEKLSKDEAGLVKAEAIVRALGVSDGLSFDALLDALSADSSIDVRAKGLAASRMAEERPEARQHVLVHPDEAVKRLKVLGFWGFGVSWGFCFRAALTCLHTHTLGTWLQCAATHPVCPPPPPATWLHCIAPHLPVPPPPARPPQMFVELEGNAPTRTGVSGPSRVAGLMRRAAEREQEFWVRMAHVISDKTTRVWHSVEKQLERYLALLQNRSNSLNEVESLQHQNTELRALLNQYLSSRINDELQIPPTQII